MWRQGELTGRAQYRVFYSRVCRWESLLAAPRCRCVAPAALHPQGCPWDRLTAPLCPAGSRNSLAATSEAFALSIARQLLPPGRSSPGISLATGPSRLPPGDGKGQLAGWCWASSCLTFTPPWMLLLSSPGQGRQSAAAQIQGQVLAWSSNVPSGGAGLVHHLPWGRRVLFSQP